MEHKQTNLLSGSLVDLLRAMRSEREQQDLATAVLGPAETATATAYIAVPCNECDGSGKPCTACQGSGLVAIPLEPESDIEQARR